MKAVVLITLLIATVASAAPSQPEQAANPSQGEYEPGALLYAPTEAAFAIDHPAPPPPMAAEHQIDYPLLTPYDHDHHHHHHYHADHQPLVSSQGQSVPVVVQAAPVQPVSQNPAVPSSVVEQPVGAEQQPAAHQLHQVPNYYSAPVGMVQVVGAEQGNNKPTVRNFEQYGQPESASIPPNYKPFGSFGLYIGGNPADGYYTNYYKALGSTVDKQQAGEPVKPVPTAALSPILRQAGSSPYLGGDYYSFAYSPADLSSASRIAVEPVQSVAHSPVGAQLSPVQAGAQVYGAPNSFESNYGVSPYADSYATKKVGAAYAQKEITKEVPLVQQPAKGYQSRVYVYPPLVASPIAPLSAPLAAPLASSQQAQQAQQQVQQVQPAQVGQQHVVAYPVPVGSQIVGSQPGVEGAFSPYGIHAFTRYAVKPTVVSHDPSYYYGVQSANQVPVYKQQVYSSHQQAAAYYPVGAYYGYPLNQLHYSQQGPVGSVHQEAHHGQVQPVFQPEGPSSYEKIEVDEKNKQIVQ